MIAPRSDDQGTLLARPDQMSHEKERAMQVQVETDNHIDNRDDLAHYVDGVVADATSRFRDQITSVQVQLTDEARGKQGPNDMRCMLEARVTGPDTAEVEFIARFRIGGGSAARLHERSRFVREGGRWLYVDGDIRG